MAGSDVVRFSLLVHLKRFFGWFSNSAVGNNNKKAKSAFFLVLIYGALREFIWHDRLSSVGPITVSIKKIQPSNALVCVLCTRAHHLFSHLSQNVSLRKHTDDTNHCLHNKSGSHGVSKINLSNFTCLLVDFGCSVVSICQRAPAKLKCFF